MRVSATSRKDCQNCELSTKKCAAPQAHSTLVLLVLLAAVLIGGTIRLWQFGESLWLDELHSAWVVAGSIGEIAERARLGNQSPLYFYLLKITTAAFGKTELALRLPSLLAGLATLLLSYAVVRSWTKSTAAGICSAAILAISPRAIFFSQEARPYAFVQFLGMLHIYLFWQLQKNPSGRRRLAVVLLGILLFWLHYTSALLLLAEATWYLLRILRAKTSYRPEQLAVDTARLAVGILPALPHLLEVFANRANWAIFVRRDSLLVAVDWFSIPIHVAAPAAICGIAAMVVWIQRRVPPSRALASGVCALTICWFLVPTSVAWLLTWFDVVRVFLPRYLAASALAPAIFAGLSVAFVRPRLARAAIAVVLVVLSAWSSGMVPQFRRDGRLLTDRTQDWRGAVRWLNRQVGDDQYPVLIRSGLIEADHLHEDSPAVFRQYCLLPVTGFYLVNMPEQRLIPLPTTDAGRIQLATVQRIESAGGSRCIINGNRRSRRQFVRDLEAALLQHGMEMLITERREFGDVLAFESHVRH
jgi:mannosyltransferase